MKTYKDGLRLRIFVHEVIRYKNKPLYEALVQLAWREGLAGATVFRGVEGYGRCRHLHTTRLLDISDDLPMIVEIVDTEAAIRRFLPLLDGIISHGTVALSPVHITTYSSEAQTTGAQT